MVSRMIKSRMERCQSGVEHKVIKLWRTRGRNDVVAGRGCRWLNKDAGMNDTRTTEDNKSGTRELVLELKRNGIGGMYYRASALKKRKANR